MKRRYGLTPAEYEAQVSFQGGACALCGVIPGYALYVDHCHRSRRNRGLLCQPCNAAIGHIDRLNDSGELERFMDYSQSAAFNEENPLAQAYQEGD